MTAPPTDPKPHDRVALDAVATRSVARQSTQAGSAQSDPFLDETGTGMFQQGTQLFCAGADVWRQGAETANTQWQHGAEACHQGIEHASGVWRQAAPFIDKGVHLANCVGAMAIMGYLIVAMVLLNTPLVDDNDPWGFNRLFWMTQGAYLIGLSLPALIATVQCGVLREGFAGWPVSFRVDLWLGILRFQLGRAIFLLGGGFYVLTVLNYFGQVSDVPAIFAWLSLLLGLVSIICGMFLLVFEVVVSWCIPRRAGYDTVPQDIEP